MKYIIDIDALKDCLDLLPTSFSDIGCVELKDVIKMIDRFPKEEYGTEYMDMLKKLTSFNEKNRTNLDILSGKGLSKI